MLDTVVHGPPLTIWMDHEVHAGVRYARQTQRQAAATHHTTEQTIIYHFKSNQHSNDLKKEKEKDKLCM